MPHTERQIERHDSSKNKGYNAQFEGNANLQYSTKGVGKVDEVHATKMVPKLIKFLAIINV